MEDQQTPGTIAGAMLYKLITISILYVTTLSLSFGQAASGTILGRVADISGGALGGARIELQPRGASTVTNVQGEYRFNDVPAGEQKLTVEFAGFATLTKTITVLSGKALQADLTMEVSGPSEQVLVTATRPRGEAEAINRSYNAINIVQVLPAEVITSLPNANIADALGRLPGVTLERDEGEGKYVQIRGTEPRYSNVTIDGVNVPSAENSRVVKLDIIPSDLVESVEINKTLLANMDGDAIGGSVNLRTKSAGERPNVSLFGIGGGTPIINGRGEDQFGGTVSQRFLKDKKLGILVGGSYDWNGRGINDIEPGPQSINCDPKNCLTPSANAPPIGTFGGTDLREYRYYRERWGVSGTVDYRFSDTSSMYARFLYSHFNNFGDRQVYSPTINSYTTSPFQGADDGNITANASIRRPVQTTGSLALGGQKFLRSSLITWELSGARAVTDDQGYSQANFGPIADSSPLNNIVFGLSFPSQYRPKFTVQNGVNIYDSSAYFLQSVDFNRTYSPQTNLQGGGSYAKYYSLNGHSGTFEAGAKVRYAHKFNDANDVYYKAADPGSLPMNKFVGNQTDSNYYDGSFGPYGPVVDYSKFRTFFDANPSAFPVNVQTTLQRNEPQKYHLAETITAAYFQNSLQFGRFRLYTGLRFEATNEDVQGNIVNVNKAGLYAGTGSITKTNSYVDPLPSVQLRYALTPDSGIRVAYGRGIARPNFSDLPPGQNISDKKNSVSAGNPNLKATHADNVDVLYERTLKPLGLIQAGFFFKNIQDPIFRVTQRLTTGTYAGYLGTMPINGSSATLYGFEIAYQQRLGFLPGPLAGAGISANYGYAHSSVDGLPGRTDRPALQRQAPNTWNVSPTYDRGRLSLRVGLSYNGANIYSYQYQDGADLGVKGPNGDNYLYEHLQVDAQASIRLSHGFTAIVAGLNLTNEVFGFYNGSPQWPNQREYYKPTYSAGVRWNSNFERK